METNDPVSFRIGKNTHKALTGNGERRVSKFMERKVTEFIDGLITVTKDDFETRTMPSSVSLSVATKQALKGKADALGVSVSGLLRVIAEKAVAAEQQGTQS